LRVSPLSVAKKVARQYCRRNDQRRGGLGNGLFILYISVTGEQDQEDKIKERMKKPMGGMGEKKKVTHPDRLFWGGLCQIERNSIKRKDRDGGSGTGGRGEERRSPFVVRKI